MARSEWFCGLGRSHCNTTDQFTVWGTASDLALHANAEQVLLPIVQKPVGEGLAEILGFGFWNRVYYLWSYLRGASDIFAA